jgi:uncharacterized cupin superfamily protein
MLHVQIPDIPWEEQRSPTGKFHSFARNISLALGGIRNTGTWGGGHPFDVQIRRVPPGATVCPFHSHLAQWELFVVLAGNAKVRAGAETHDVTIGDVFIHPPNEPHQLTNSGPSELEVLIIADNPPLDAFHYPDSNKWGLRPPGKYFRITEVDYFDGEEPTTAVPSGYHGSAAGAFPPITPFAQRKRRIDDIAWELWESPKKKFRGSSKELSIALGAKHNTPPGLGGHPFDLEHGKLAPGETGCPFHSHAAQWELFMIMSGTATVRANDSVHTLRAGDVCLHPPMENHQIRNASPTEELLYYLVADNPPVDYWFYPDSKKMGLKAPRTFFRPINVEYYDGEE